MTPDEIIRAWFRDVWNEGREDAIDRLMGKNALVHGLSGPGEAAAIVGPDAFKPYFQSMRSALQDIHVDVVRTVVQGDLVAAHCHVQARHAGEGLGGPPTGQRVSFWGITITRVSDGQIVEGWNCFDFLSMYQQLGWLQHPVVPR